MPYTTSKHHHFEQCVCTGSWAEMHSCVCMCVCVCVYVCVYVCVNVSVCVSIYKILMYLFTYLFISYTGEEKTQEETIL